jgi:hypothetical protein
MMRSMGLKAPRSRSMISRKLGMRNTVLFTYPTSFSFALPQT